MMMASYQKRIQAQAVCAKRGVVLGIGVILLLYVTACCAWYMQNMDIFFLRSWRGLGSSTTTSTTPTPELSEAEQKAATRAELGRGVWNMLHRMGAQFDKEPTAQRQLEMVNFFSLFGEFYPCPECAAHFREMVKEIPVRAGNNRELSLWLCEVHNVVNKRLEKPLFPCDLDSLKERWGSCGCFENATTTTEEEILQQQQPSQQQEQATVTAAPSTTSKGRKLRKNQRKAPAVKAEADSSSSSVADAWAE